MLQKTWHCYDSRPIPGLIQGHATVSIPGHEFSSVVAVVSDAGPVFSVGQAVCGMNGARGLAPQISELAENGSLIN
ncbi:MAG: hypothetical protein JWM11_6610 [Planctomycetaceae bacterium]|nr:hypothetical protein [Planctomycetaceae bacterium]